MVYFYILRTTLKSGSIEDMRNDEPYDVFDSEVCYECLSLGMAIAIFIV